MPDSSIIIGSIRLQDFEIPQFVHFGGRQRLTAHILANGQKIIEPLGPDDGDIKFQGIISGPNAEARARMLDTLRRSGNVVWLTWGSFTRQIILKVFTASYHSPWWIPYEISCAVVNQTPINVSQIFGSAALLSSDLGMALAAATGSATSLTSLQTALSTPNLLTAATADQANALAAGNTALNAVTAQITGQSTTLAIQIGPYIDPMVTSTLFSTRVACAGTLAAAVNVRSYIGRIQVNIKGPV